MQIQQKIPVQTGIYDFQNEDMSDLKLMGSLCIDCGEKYFPPKTVCLQCSSRNLDNTILSDSGTIETYTVVRQPSPLWKGSVPYIIVAVLLDDGVKVTSHLIDYDSEQVIIGDRVKIAAGKLREDEDGRVIMAHMFRPIKTKESQNA